MDPDLKSYIVDDQPASVERMKSLLAKCPGVNVIGSEASPVDAVEDIINKQPDVVFLDIEMPRLSGFELIDKVRERHVFPTFVIITGYSQYAIKAIKARAFDYLLKPVDLDELKETLFRLSPREELNRLLLKLDLTVREREIVELILKGLSSREIGEKLFISKNTVNTHRRNLLERNHLKNTRELLLYFNIEHSGHF